MTISEFWRIIDAGTGETDLEKRNQVLVETLSSYPEDDIISFEIHLRQVLEELDNFYIVGILKVLIGTVTDDFYLYFRCWIISNGQSLMSGIQTDGDIVLEKLDFKDIPLFEDLLYVATLSYGNKIGTQDEDDRFPRATAEAKQLSYDFKNTTKGVQIPKPQLKKKFPRLWQACRITPPPGSFCEYWVNRECMMVLLSANGLPAIQLISGRGKTDTYKRRHPGRLLYV